MKKFFIALAVMAALMFSVAPSQALNSMPDDVPGTNPLLPFFLVSKAGFSANTGLDTLFVVQEISGGFTKGATKGYLHTVIRNYKSVEVGDTTFPYTPRDVVPFSVRDLLKNYVGVTQLPGLEITLNGVVYYTGYIDWENYIPLDPTNRAMKNLVAFMYLVDLDNGWAAAETAPVWEPAAVADGYHANQRHTYTSDLYGAYVLENFSAVGLATTQARERGSAVPTGTVASSFRLMPRYFLKDANAQTWIPIWSSCNKLSGTTYTYPITCFLYDSDENSISVPINIPYELNWLDIRTLLPTGGAWAAVTGGWLDIPFPSTGRSTVLDSAGNVISWLAYSYQTASSASIGANWSVLTGVHREVGTL
jgi:hypothetical protein